MSPGAGGVANGQGPAIDDFAITGYKYGPVPWGSIALQPGDGTPVAIAEYKDVYSGVSCGQDSPDRTQDKPSCLGPRRPPRSRTQLLILDHELPRVAQVRLLGVDRAHQFAGPRDDPIDPGRAGNGQLHLRGSGMGSGCGLLLWRTHAEGRCRGRARACPSRVTAIEYSIDGARRNRPSTPPRTPSPSRPERRPTR